MFLHVNFVYVFLRAHYLLPCFKDVNILTNNCCQVLQDVTADEFLMFMTILSGLKCMQCKIVTFIYHSDWAVAKFCLNFYLSASIIIYFI